MTESSAMMQDAATFTIGEAVRTPVFWCLTLTELAQGIVWTGINFHCVHLVESSTPAPFIDIAVPRGGIRARGIRAGFLLNLHTVD
jgi:hypothetical protein